MFRLSSNCLSLMGRKQKLLLAAEVPVLPLYNHMVPCMVACMKELCIYNRVCIALWSPVVDVSPFWLCFCPVCLPGSSSIGARFLKLALQPPIYRQVFPLQRHAVSEAVSIDVGPSKHEQKWKALPHKFLIDPHLQMPTNVHIMCCEGFKRYSVIWQAQSL